MKGMPAVKVHYFLFALGPADERVLCRESQRAWGISGLFVYTINYLVQLLLLASSRQVEVDQTWYGGASY
jgi:hypothetical protein